MKVSQLIQILSELDEDGDVYVMLQPSWPFECGIAGVAVRADFTECEEDEPEDLARVRSDRWGAPPELLPGNDVFIVAGDQTRYGNAGAWDVARRR
ncbi:MAG: hypothetical protein KC619_21285 [Myxococcales bacterium]|nr:hypothetical protein [Myxococcales bacterium]